MQVLFTVSVGKGCRGLDFVATSNSPTADPMLRGCWECQATDRDLARYVGLHVKASCKYHTPNKTGFV